MNQLEKIIKPKLGLLELAKQLGNVSGSVASVKHAKVKLQKLRI